MALRLLQTKTFLRSRIASTSLTSLAALNTRSAGFSPSSVRWFSQSQRESMDFDVVIVGAGPAGLSAAIRLKQQAQKADADVNVCVVEKGPEVGRHILSGNVFNPRALNELIPDWKNLGAPLETKVTRDQVRFLTSKSSIPLPTPPALHNDGNYIISLGNLCRWLGEQAEELGVEVYPGFSASEVLYGDAGEVVGIATSDMGLDKDGKPKDTYAPGMELRAKQTIFAEGARGSLSELVIDKFQLRESADPQVYGIGIKEVWEVDESKIEPGLVQHTLGWPLDSRTYGGSFMYHMGPNRVLLGLVVGLDYENPYLSPYEEFQRMKHHPHFQNVLEGGECVQYGARVINEGGYQSIPTLTFPGGLLVGCSAGFVNVPQIKGSHYAMKTGITAADSVWDSFKESQSIAPGLNLKSYEESLKDTWVYKELKAVRNYKPSFHWGLYPGILYSGLEAYIFRGHAPWTLRNKSTDAEATKKASECEKITYPAPDGKLSFDLLSNLTRSGVYHEDNQPVHLKVKPELKHVPEEVSYQEYAAPESRFCPAKVYEYVTDDDGGKPKLVINSQNCIHCKTCSIKTPHEYINWTVPEGGGGPSYEGM